MEAGGYFVRSMMGRFWRLQMRAVGPSVLSMAARHDSAASLASAGRMTVQCGMARREARCSMGSCVGPSSPRPMLSWVNWKMTGARIRAARRSDGRQ